MAEAVNARSGTKGVRKKSFALEGKNNARSRQCPKRSMPEAFNAGVKKNLHTFMMLVKNSIDISIFIVTILVQVSCTLV